MAYKLLEIELSIPPDDIALQPDQDGCGIVARWHGTLIGFAMCPMKQGILVSREQILDIANSKFALPVLEAKLAEAVSVKFTERPADPGGSRPTLTIAICTKDRPERLRRLLGSLQEVKPQSILTDVETLVIDNASVDLSTREVVSEFQNIRYVFEPKAGLNFARNAAIEAASGDYIAYLDDDVVVDKDWLLGLAEAWSSSKGAGGFTGLVLPYRLDTRAQVMFERRGGFGRGFRRLEYRDSLHGNPLYPVGAGIFGAGCNMTFERALLIQLGGFDEALDTGQPLPGGGDLDMFYRVIRAGRTMVYMPRYAVYHEHRETVEQLRRQYWSWGLGMMAFLVKSWRTDPALNSRHRQMVAWWFKYQLKNLTRSLRKGNLIEATFSFSEIWGGIMGLAGEYDRSCKRIRAIREAQP